MRPTRLPFPSVSVNRYQYMHAGLSPPTRTREVQSAALETGACACAMTWLNASSSETSTVSRWRVPWTNGRLVHKITLCGSGSPEATPWG